MPVIFSPIALVIVVVIVAAILKVMIKRNGKYIMVLEHSTHSVISIALWEYPLYVLYLLARVL